VLDEPTSAGPGRVEGLFGDGRTAGPGYGVVIVTNKLTRSQVPTGHPAARRPNHPHGSTLRYTDEQLVEAMVGAPSDLPPRRPRGLTGAAVLVLAHVSARGDPGRRRSRTSASACSRRDCRGGGWRAGGNGSCRVALGLRPVTAGQVARVHRTRALRLAGGVGWAIAAGVVAYRRSGRGQRGANLRCRAHGWRWPAPRSGLDVDWKVGSRTPRRTGGSAEDADAHRGCRTVRGNSACHAHPRPGSARAPRGRLPSRAWTSPHPRTQHSPGAAGRRRRWLLVSRTSTNCSVCDRLS